VLLGFRVFGVLTATPQLARPEMERLQARMKQNAGDPDAVKVYQRELAAIWDKCAAMPARTCCTDSADAGTMPTL